MLLLSFVIDAVISFKRERCYSRNFCQGNMSICLVGDNSFFHWVFFLSTLCNTNLSNNSRVVRALGYQSRGPAINTTRWLQIWLSLSCFRVCWLKWNFSLVAQQLWGWWNRSVEGATKFLKKVLKSYTVVM